MIFTTRGWTGASIVYTHASGAATYTVASDKLNAYDVAVALRAWLDDAARPWAGDISSVTLTVEADTADRRLRFVYTFAGSSPTFVSVVPNSTWIARFGDTSQSPPTAAAATCSGEPGSIMWERWDASEGERSREGAWRWGDPHSAHRRPVVSLELDIGQAYALHEAVRAASQPRQAYILDEMTDTWRLVTVGALSLDHPEGDRTLMVGTLDVLGGL